MRSAIIAMWLLLSGPCAAADAQPSLPDPVLDNAVRAKIPLAAIVKGVDATVKLQCSVTEHSAWDHCTLVTEDPVGLGFGDAALALAKNFPAEPASFTPTASAIATVTYHRFTITTEAQGITHVIRSPDWAERPTAAQLSSIFNPTSLPHRAGSATIECIVTVEGKLDPCRVTEEAPEGFGVGRGALAMARTFKMRPMTFDGKAMGGALITIPLRMFAR